MLPSDVSKQDGWTQGVWWNTDGQRCAVGAALRAFTGEDMQLEAQRHPEYARVREFFGPGDSLVAWFKWNDVAGRTHEEVIAALYQREVELGLRNIESPVPWAERGLAVSSAKELT